MKTYDHWPKWANYMATDEDGSTYVFERRPTLAGKVWSPNGGRFAEIHTPCPDWKESLEERPK